jgi:hypothetical protein
MLNQKAELDKEKFVEVVLFADEKINGVASFRQLRFYNVENLMITGFSNVQFEQANKCKHSSPPELPGIPSANWILSISI